MPDGVLSFKGTFGVTSGLDVRCRASTTVRNTKHVQDDHRLVRSKRTRLGNGPTRKQGIWMILTWGGSMDGFWDGGARGVVLYRADEVQVTEDRRYGAAAATRLP
jgi:hypothetical protein